ncbi:unnamed protein product [Euphydryas editha]|uniref:FP protein C-terminal domain-containing protein n=1 Tax=Euphydryas editha TaxID=104508 RepID=A0AAU9V4N2_EUPED|nr:unnamed protein product [Euphydryas editha]
MIRSPNKQYGSESDIAGTAKSSALESNITLRKNERKRKHGEELTDMFQDFKDDIKGTLQTWKLEFEQELKNLNKLFVNDIKEELNKLSSNTNDLKREVAGISRDFSVIKEEFLSLRSSVEFTSTQYDDMNTKLSAFSNDIKKIKAMETELIEVRNQCRALQEILNINDQRDRLLNLEFVGVPETKEEDLHDLTMKIAQAANVTINSCDIIQANRVSPRVKMQGRTRTIVVKFRSRLIKDNIFSGARKNRITTKTLDIPGNPVPVFVNEHLTPYNKTLLKKLKAVAKDKAIQYVWTKNGRIYSRKNNLSPAVHIQTEEDIVKLK